MKHYYQTQRVVFTLITAFTWFNLHPCFTQKIQGNKFHHFSHLTSQNAELLKNHWNEMFQTDITGDLTSLSDTVQNKPEIEIHSIFMDAYGNIYPDLNVFSGLPPKVFKRANNDLDMSHYSLYTLTHHKSTKDQVKANLERYYGNKLTYPASMEVGHKIFQSKQPKVDDSGLKTFNDQWFKTNNPILIQPLLDKIKKNHYDTVLFFFHGYNVPQGLATLQVLELRKLLNETLPSSSRMLLVPIYWPSNTAKEATFYPKDGDRYQCIRNGANGRCLECKTCTKAAKKFSTKNDTYPLFGGFKNKRKFSRYSKHAYLAGLTLRAVLNELPAELNVWIYAHSLGNTASTSVVINTISKINGLNLCDTSTSRLVNCDIILHGKCLKYDEKDHFLDLFITRSSLALPQQPVRLFLSAAAIPGYGTFVDLPQKSDASLELFVTANRLDPMLQKSMIPILNKLGIARSSRFGATTLGCDYNNDIARTKSVFTERGYAEENFKVAWFFLKDHDVFYHIDKPEYRALFSQFVNGPNPKESAPLDSFLTTYNSIYGQTLMSQSHSYERMIWSQRTKAKYLGASDVNHMADPLKDLLIKNEVVSGAAYTTQLDSATLKMLMRVDDIYVRLLLNRSLYNDTNKFIQGTQFTKESLRNKLIAKNEQMLWQQSKAEYPFYRYTTGSGYEKPLFHAIGLEHGNDLLALWRNLDREYTGQVKIWVSTPYLNTPRKRPLKTYQQYFIGADVWTPQFTDTTKFKSFDDYDSLDRPHGSFGYFGWQKNGLSKYNKLRWQYTLKIGKIGGNAGRLLQVGLHQDVSYSLRPKGWDAQIANGGRLGWSAEVRYDKLITISDGMLKKNSDAFLRLYFVPSILGRIGSYMTTSGIGLRFMNRPFKEVNHDLVRHRRQFTGSSLFDNLYFSFGADFNYVFHNTMLEGYGIFRTTENNPDKVDGLTPLSAYYLNPNQVRRITGVGDITLAYTTKYFSLYYRYAVMTPETKLGTINFNHYGKNETINLNHYYHRFATLGAVFYLP